MSERKKYKRIVIKAGTSTLAHDTGKANIRHIKRLISVIADIRNSGIEVAFVTSGAIGVGAGKLGMSKRPDDTAGRQAASTVGQTELMFLYDKFFGEFGYTVGQFLLTKRDVEMEDCRRNIVNALEKSFKYGVIPIINENDSVAIDEIVYGDNDNLSAIVAKLVNADALLILTDIDGFYDGNPEDEHTRLVPVVDDITDDMMKIAGGRGSTLGTGGMVTKLQAARVATEAGIETVILSGIEPERIYRVIEGKSEGTLFRAAR